MLFYYPEEKDRLTDKNEIVKWIEAYLHEEGNSLADLNSIIPNLCPPSHQDSSFIRDIAHKMKRSGKYELIEEKGMSDFSTRYFVRPLPKKTWRERNPLGAEIRTGLITFIFSVLAALLLLLITNQEKDRKNTQQDEHLSRLSDSVKILEKKIDDLKKH